MLHSAIQIQEIKFVLKKHVFEENYVWIDGTFGFEEKQANPMVYMLWRRITIYLCFFIQFFHCLFFSFLIYLCYFTNIYVLSTNPLSVPLSIGHHKHTEQYYTALYSRTHTYIIILIILVETRLKFFFFFRFKVFATTFKVLKQLGITNCCCSIAF